MPNHIISAEPVARRTNSSQVGRNSRTNFIVYQDETRISWFQENKWFIKHSSYVHARHYLGFDFSIEIANRDLLTAHRNWRLLASVKWFIWARLNPHENRNSNGAPSVVYKDLANVGKLLRFMYARGYRQFGEIDRDLVEDYILFLKKVRIGRHGLAARTIANEAQLIHSLYEERARMPKWSRMKAPPWTNRNPIRIAGEDEQSVRPLSLEVVNPLVERCHDWITIRAPDIVKATSEVDAIYRLPHTQQKRMELFRSWRERFQFSRDRSGNAWRGPLRDQRDLRQEHQTLITACFILIALFVGPRQHEILSLDLNSSVSMRLSDDGSFEIFFLKGKTSKAGDGSAGNKRRWVIGARPAGSKEPLLALMAYETLQALGRARPPKAPFAFVSAKVRTPISGRMWGHLQEFLRTLFPTDNEVFDLNAMRFRKTFSTFVGRYDTLNLTGILSQLGHAGLAQISRYTGDPQLKELIGAARLTSVASVLYDVASSSNLAGRRGTKIALANKLARVRARFSSREEFVDQVSKLLKDESVRLFLSAWGVCYYHEQNAACGGGKFGPNFNAREFSVCCSCENYIAAELHRPWLETRVTLIDEFLDEYEGPKFLVDLQLAERRRLLDIIKQLCPQP